MKQSVLFLCIHNSARSIMAEYFLRQQANNQFDVFSAGFKPGAEIHPLTLQILKKDFGINAYKARSRSWEEFSDRQFDFVFTLCREARETCPQWPGQPQISRWDITDPVGPKSEDLRQITFATVAKEIRVRLLQFGRLSKEEREPYRMVYSANKNP